MKVYAVCYILMVIFYKATYCEPDTNSGSNLSDEYKKTMEVYQKAINVSNSTEVEDFSLNDTKKDEELSRGHKNKLKKKKNKKKFLKKILPLLLIPILIQSAIIPLVVMKLKFLVIKAIAVGKLAILLVGLNYLYTTLTTKISDSRQDLNEAYGYNGGLEYGAYINRREDKFLS